MGEDWESERPSLLQIRRNAKYYSSCTAGKSTDTGLSKSAAAAEDFVLPCTLDISISGLPDDGVLIERQFCATISGRRGPIPQFHIEFDSPLTSDFIDDYVAQHGALNGAKERWRRRPRNLEGCQLKFRVHCDIEQDNKTLGAMLYVDRKFECVEACWNGLPDCPSATQSMNVRCKIKKSHSEDTSTWTNSIFEMEVTMGWVVKARSSLVRFNESLSRAFEEPHQQNGALNTVENSTRQVRIAYIYCQSRRLILEDLTCPFCQTGVEFAPFDRLHLHLLTYHEHFKTEVEDASRLDSSVVRKIVQISLAEYPIEKSTARGKNEEEHNWIAPKRPFDLPAHLSGNDTWTAHMHPKTPGRGRQRKQREQGSAIVPVKAPQPMDRVLQPEKVAYLPQRQRRLHAMPTAKNADGEDVRFYRTVSKRVFVPGELVAESDDDVNDSWLVQRQRQNIKGLRVKTQTGKRRLTAAEQEFVEDFNRHLDDEEAVGDRLARDGVVRFARKHRQKMPHPGWQGQFQSTLRRLQRYRVIDKATAEYCLAQAPEEELPFVSDEDDMGYLESAQGDCPARASQESARKRARMEPRGRFDKADLPSLSSYASPTDAHRQRRRPPDQGALTNGSPATSRLHKPPPGATGRVSSASVQLDSPAGRVTRRKWHAATGEFIFVDEEGELCPPPSSTPSKTAARPRTQERTRPDSHTEPEGDQMDVRDRGNCECGKAVTSHRGSIFCDNAVSTSSLSEYSAADGCTALPSAPISHDVRGSRTSSGGMAL